MNTSAFFLTIVCIGCYFLYVRPKLNIFNSFKNDPNFSNYLLIIESNSEFDKKNYEKAMKHFKLFLLYYSQSFDNELMFEKMKKQHDFVIRYLNRMLFAIPNSMRRYNYMQNAVTNIDLLLKQYLKMVADKYDISYVYLV